MTSQPPRGISAEDITDLWNNIEALRNSMNAGEYKHVVLGLLFLRYISDSFEDLHARLKADMANGADPEDRDEYRAENVFWIPLEARWQAIKAKAKSPEIGVIVDEAMIAIESENAALKGVLPKEYARPAIDKQYLGRLIDIVNDIGLGAAKEETKSILGTVYEEFLTRFALAEGMGGDQSYTPRSVVRLLVEMITPRKGRLYDPACGSGGMFVYSEQFVAQRHGRIGDLSIYGQDVNHTTCRLAKMNLAIRGIDAQIEHGDSFHDPKQKDLKADFILCNPPFNDGGWHGELLRDDARWKYGVPPPSNANFAWVQHFIHYLAPAGTAGFVLANGSMSSNQSGEGDIRREIVKADLVDCMVALPGQLFYSTQIPVCLWFLTRSKRGGAHRDRSGETLFIDAREMGYLWDRTHRQLRDEEIAKIAGTYHAWRGDAGAEAYADVPGFCKSAALGEIEKHGYVLTPGRYVGSKAVEDDGEPFEEKMRRLVGELREQMGRGRALDTAISQNIEELGYGA